MWKASRAADDGAPTCTGATWTARLRSAGQRFGVRTPRSDHGSEAALSCRVRSDARAIAGCGSTAYCPWLWLCLRFRSKLQRSAATCDDRRRRPRGHCIAHYTNDDTINDIADEWTNLDNSRHRVEQAAKVPRQMPRLRLLRWPPSMPLPGRCFDKGHR